MQNPSRTYEHIETMVYMQGHQILLGRNLKGIVFHDEVYLYMKSAGNTQ